MAQVEALCLAKLSSIVVHLEMVLDGALKSLAGSGRCTRLGGVIDPFDFSVISIEAMMLAAVTVRRDFFDFSAKPTKISEQERRGHTA